MSDSNSRLRRSVGEHLPPFTVETLRHGALQVPGARFIHLQFRRFAGCPICSLHLRSFALAERELREAGVSTVAFFHSSVEQLASYYADLPFPVVPDPSCHWYAAFGVERSPRALLDPRAWLAGIRGALQAPPNPFAAEGGFFGLPADFLVSPEGQLLALKYGSHANDQWDVRDLIGLVKRRSSQ